MDYSKTIRRLNYCYSGIYLIAIGFYFQHIPSGFLFILLALNTINIALVFFKIKKPSVLIVNLLAFVCLAALFFIVGFSDTVQLFVAMLILATLLKCLQANSKPVFKTISLLTFFNLSTVYLFQQGILATAVISLLFIAAFATLILIHQNHSIATASKNSSKLLLLALPLSMMLLLFLPKMPAFWQLPGPKLAKTGLSDKVDPFSIAKLSESDELVFRAQIDADSLSAPNYWRSIIHDEFNNGQWLVSDILKNEQFKLFSNNTESQFTSAVVSYTVIAEPSSNKWLYAKSFGQTDSEDVKTTHQGLVERQQFQNKKIKYGVISKEKVHPNGLTAWENKHYTTIDRTYNKQSQQLAQQLKANSADDNDFFQQLLKYYKDQGFSYTLTPEVSNSDSSIDDFMYQTKAGFCGHYASSAAYLFRIAGIPARVVSGYLGGETNQQGNYLTVYQYDAHAWVEVFIDQTWRTFDATAVVAPQRLTGSLSQYNELSEEFTNNLNFGLASLSNFAAINWLRLQLENMDYQWTNWVLTFDQQSQQNLMASLVGNKYVWLVPIALIVSLILFFTGYFMLVNRAKKSTEPFVNELSSLYKLALKSNIAIDFNNTPNENLSLIAKNSPSNKNQLLQLITLYNEVKYQQKPFNQKRKTQTKNLLKSIQKTKLD